MLRLELNQVHLLMVVVVTDVVLLVEVVVVKMVKTICLALMILLLTYNLKRRLISVHLETISKSINLGYYNYFY